MRQRPLCMAGDLQAIANRVFAPHLGAARGFPGGLPFFNHPRRFAWGSLFILSVAAQPHPIFAFFSWGGP